MPHTATVKMCVHGRGPVKLNVVLPDLIFNRHQGFGPPEFASNFIKLAEKNTRESEEKRLREEEERRKIKQLVKVYSSMKPKDAAPVIEKLNIDVAKKIFMQMKGEQAGRILSYISKNRAAEISEELIAKNNRK